MKRLLSIFKKTLIILFINVATITVLVYGFEFYLRKSDPFFTLPFDLYYFNSNLHRYEGKINPPADSKDYVYTWGHKVENNRFGRRDRNFDTPKPQGTIRIIVLGDSFTWGAGLANRERYSDILDSLLNAEFPQSRWEVLNFGFSGGPTVGEADVLKGIKNVVEPDLILVGFCLNDPQQQSQNYSIEREEFIKRNSARLDSVKSNFRKLKLVYVGDFVESAVYRLAEVWGTIPRWEQALNRSYIKTSKDWKAFSWALSDIKKVSDSLHCPAPVFASFNQLGAIAIPEEISTHNRNDRDFQMRLHWFDQARYEADSIGYQVVDCGPLLTQNLESGNLKFEDLTLNPLDPHPSPEMNQIYAQAIFEKIKNELATDLLEKAEHK